MQKSSLTRKVSFSEELEQVKVFLTFDDKEVEDDNEVEEVIVTIVPNMKEEGHPLQEAPLPLSESKVVAVEEPKPVSPKSVTKSWSFFKLFKSPK